MRLDAALSGKGADRMNVCNNGAMNQSVSCQLLPAPDSSSW